MKWIISSLAFLAFAAAVARPASAQLPIEGEGTISSEFVEDRDRFNRQLPTAFHFLKIAPTARLAGMGGAYTAVADGMDAIFYNPAGIASIERVGWAFGYSQWFGNTDYYSGAVAINTTYGVLGVSVLNLKFPDVEQTTPLNPDGTGQMLDFGDTGIGFAYAYRMTDKMSAGIQLRYVKSKLGLEEEISAWLLSAGTVMQTGFESLRIGMGIKNLGKNVSAIDFVESPMPSVFNVGVSGEVVGDLGDPVSLTLAFEGAYHVDSNQRYHVGAELWLRDLLALRAGNQFRYDAQSWSVGAGFKGTFGGRSIMADVSYSELDALLDHNPVRMTVSGSF